MFIVCWIRVSFTESWLLLEVCLMYDILMEISMLSVEASLTYHVLMEINCLSHKITRARFLGYVDL